MGAFSPPTHVCRDCKCDKSPIGKTSAVLLFGVSSNERRCMSSCTRDTSCEMNTSACNCTLVEVMPDPLHGPTIREEFRHITSTMVVFWVVGVLCVAVQLAVSWLHDQKLSAVKPGTILGDYYQMIMWLPQIFAVTSMLGLFLPRAHPLFEFIRVTSEACALLLFNMMMMHLMAAEGGKGTGYVPQGDLRKQCIKALEDLPPMQLWSVPPFGCLFRRWEQRRRVTEHHAKWATRFVKQYILFAPVLQFSYLLMQLNQEHAKSRQARRGLQAINALTFLSMLTAVYGIFVIWGVTRVALADFKTSAKFAFIKILVILQKATTITLDLLGSWFRVSVLTESLPDTYDEQARRSMLVNVVTVVEALMLTCLMTRAFPPSDLSVAHCLRVSGSKTPHAESQHKLHSFRNLPSLLSSSSNEDEESMAGSIEGKSLLRSQALSLSDSTERDSM
eukprot:g433.t1